MASAVGDTAELLHVDVDECAGLLTFVAADHLAGGETVQAVAGQDPVHGRGRQSQHGADPCRAELSCLPQFTYPRLNVGGGAVRSPPPPRPGK